MNIATFIGFIMGVTGIILAVIFNGGDFNDFLDVPSAMIVLGGTLSATLINFPFKDVFGVFIVAKNAFIGVKSDYVNIIDRFLALGYGEHRPLFPNDTFERRTANRGVEIFIDADVVKKSL